jgi:hypothetical protein
MRWIGVFVLLMAGCGSVPVTPSSAVVAPDHRILAFQGEAGRSDGSVIVLRDNGFVGKNCLNSITINGTLSARLAVAEKARFLVKAGAVTITAGKDPYGNDMCQMHQGDSVTQTFTLGEGEARSFRLSIDSGGKLMLGSI